MSSVVDLTEYVIRITLDMKAPTVHQSLAGIEKAVEGIHHSITRGILGPLAALAAGSGFAILTAQVLELHTEVQNAEFSVASLYNAIAGVPIENALQRSHHTVQKLVEDAAAGAGEFEDYIKSYSMILGPSLQAGANTDQVRELNRLMLTTSYLLRGKAGLIQGPIDVMQALTSGVGTRTTAQVVNQVLQAAGISLEEYRAMGRNDQFNALMKGFHQFDDAVALMGKSWDIQMEKMKSGLKVLIREPLTQPLFERWSEQLAKVNEWLFKNKDILKELTEVWSKRLLAAYDSFAEHGPGAMLGITAIGAVASGNPLAMLGVALAVAAKQYPAQVEQIVVSLGRLGGALLGLLDSIGKASELSSGGGILGAMDAFIRGLVAFVQIFDLLMTTAQQSFANTLSFWKNLPMMLLMMAHNPASAGAIMNQAMAPNNMLMNHFSWKLDRILHPHEYTVSVNEKNHDEALTAPGNVNIENVTVTIQAEHLDDPARVATTFDAILQKVRRNPRSSGVGRTRPGRI